MKKPDWKKIKEDYLRLKGDVNLKEFAEKHGVGYSTLRSRKNREKWDSELATKKKSVASKKKSKKKANTLPVEEVDRVLDNPELNDKQKLFCLYYTKYFNATKAYQKAYKCDYLTANTNGPRLLVNASIKNEIQSLKQGKLNRAMLEEDDIVQKYIDIAFADMKDYVSFGEKEKIIGISDKGDLVKVTDNFIDLKNDSEVDGTLITEIKEGQQGITIKLKDSMKALEWLANYFEMNPEHRLRKEFQMKKQRLAEERFEHEKNIDSKKYWL